MKGRTFQSESYRYGFNGKENDSDWDVQDYGFRIYKPELGKFLSVDPLCASYPWNSAYAFAENRPINGIDLEGGEWLLMIFSPDLSEAFIKAADAGDVYEQRRITYYALNREFKNEIELPNDWAQKQTFMSDDKSPNNKAAILVYDPSIEGVLVKTFHETKDRRIVQDNASYLFYTSNEKFMPVDIRGEDYYQGNDFIAVGIQADMSIAGKPTFRQNKTGAGILGGYMRGFGFIQLKIDVHAMSVYEAGLSSLVMSGKFHNSDIEAYANTEYNALQTLSGYYKSEDGGSTKNLFWNISFEKFDLKAVPKPQYLDGVEKTSTLTFKVLYKIISLEKYNNKSVISKTPND